ncbi:MAG TPA: class I SAM-dependent methyltransferase [Anaerolineae bacterium]|nr:class I SAM-dependent methyltransferase [Anaerolineae bacterium]
MEETNCNLCGADDTVLMYTERDRWLGLPGSFRLVRCQQCGLAYLNPRPALEDMAFYYPATYGPHRAVPEDEASLLSYLNHTCKYGKRTAVIRSARPQGGRLLDIGCATGSFLHVMGQSGSWEVCGVEPNADAAHCARDRFGLDVFEGTLKNALFSDAYFDVVTMWEVIEHLHDPRSTLLEIHRILKPEGMLVVSTPNLSSWDATFFGRHWMGLDAPRHLYVFSPRALRQLLRRTGFECQRTRSVVGLYYSVRRSAQFWLDEHARSGKTKKLLLAILSSRFSRAIAYPYLALSNLAGRAGDMTMIGTKVATTQTDSAGHPRASLLGSETEAIGTQGTGKESAGHLAPNGTWRTVRPT